MDTHGRAIRSEAILEASAQAIERLSSAAAWREVGPEILEALGVAAEVSRVYLFENSTREDEELVQDECFEWTAAGIPTTIEDPENHGWPYSQGMARYPALLRAGEVLHGPAGTFPPEEQADLREEGILSTAFVPVFAGEDWWGYLGFDDCSTERLWSPVEIAALRAGAAALGSAIYHEHLDEERRKAESFLRSHVEQLPAVTYIEFTDADHALGYDEAYVSPQITTMFGYTQEEWLGDRDLTLWAQIIHPDDRQRVDEIAAGTARTGEPYVAEYRLKNKRTGQWVWVRDEAHLVKGDGSVRPYWHGVIVDLTETKNAQEELARAQELYRGLVEQIPAITYLEVPEDDHGKTIYVSPQIETILGVTPEAWIDPGEEGDLWVRMIHPDDRERVLREYEEWVAGGPDLSDYRMIRPDGQVVWIRDRGTPIRDKDGALIMDQGFMFDVTDQKKAEEQIAFLAYHDPLTGLANRKMFEEMLEAALARARRQDLFVAVLFMDMDDFKQVNDSLGHDMGDVLLKQVAERLREATRETDLVARQGGDEFLVMIPDIEATERGEFLDDGERAVRVPETMAERIHRAMRAPFALGDVEVGSSMSIGISVFPLDAQDTRTLLKNSDAAMYRSKRSRPGSFTFSPRTSADPLVGLSMARRLREAVEGRHWVLHYQPMVELRTRAIIGVEALLRWRRPKGELVPAAQFISVAEEMGVMEVIGEWVIEELCAQARVWSAEGLEPQLSFNLSPRQLWRRDLAQGLASSFRDSGIDPSRVIVEISEATAATDPARTQRILHGLREQGMRIAIDDFGTGYSPPGRLRSLPVDILKIDNPLVRDLPQDVEVGGFVEAVISFAASLEIACLAEGIESEEQRAFLLEKGCRLGQGYLFSRPVSGQEITGLFGVL